MMDKMRPLVTVRGPFPSSLMVKGQIDNDLRNVNSKVEIWRVGEESGFGDMEDVIWCTDFLSG